MKNMLLKILLALIVLAASPIQAYATTTSDNSIQQIIFFGDSLTDPGNLYHYDVGTLPKSPPYFKGRFSNGPTWAEVVADYFKFNKEIDSMNFAIGGESVIYHDTSKGYYPFMLDQSLSEYFVTVDPFGMHPDLSHNLFVFLIGANDYLWGSEDPESDTTNVTNGLKNSVNNLIKAGGKNILLLNLPDLSIVPASRIGGDIETLKELTRLHNLKLQGIVAELQTNYPDINIKVFDYYTLTNEIIVNPASANQKYNTHISNTIDACYPGGYQLMQDKTQEAEIAAALEQIYKTDTVGLLHKHSAAQKIDFSALAHSLVSNPALNTAYLAGQNALTGIQPCDDPSSYLFWDMVHPSAEGHAITGKMVIEYIEKNYPV